MTIDESSLRNQILELKDFRKWANKNELLFLPQLMENTEKIKAVTSVLYIERKWLLVITDKKLIFLYRKIMNGIQETVPVSAIESFTCKTGIMFARLTIQTDTKTMVLDSILKKEALLIRDILSEMLK